MPRPLSAAQRRGRLAELLAERWLSAQRVELLARNVRYRGGEIDLIGREEGWILFIEVRCRARGAPISPLLSVTTKKRKHIATAAARWLTKQGLSGALCRFDLVEVTAAADSFRLRWRRGAFVLD